jgi:hypothetical protein
MAERKKKTAEDVAFDERTKMIDDYIAKLRERIAAKKAGEQEAEAQSG